MLQPPAQILGRVQLNWAMEITNLSTLKEDLKYETGLSG